MRRWDTTDERFYRLSWGTATRKIRENDIDYALGDRIEQDRVGEDDSGNCSKWKLGSEWTPDEREVWFVNKADPEQDLCFEYLGVEFTNWAPGWGFLILGKRLHSPVEDL